MIKISAIVITLNEERKIGRCIESLKKVSDEIIVVDSFSTDRTKAICEEKQVTFIQHAFEGHIQQKNFALDQVSHEYVLALDGDEYLSDELIQSIRQLKQGKVGDAYYMLRLSSIRGRWIYGTDWYPERKLRLWRKEVGRWGGYNPHDHVVLNKGLSPQKLSGYILHEAIDSVEMMFRKAYSYANIYAIANQGRVRSSTPKIIYKSLFTFFRSYILRRGIIYGFDGLVISFGLASYTFFKYSILKDLNEKH